MILWPTTLPLPLVALSGNPQNATEVSDAQFAQHNRRARFQYSTYALQAQFYFTIGQRDIFEAFYASSLFNGAAAFKICLRYPYTNELTPWLVRFLGPYTSTYVSGLWGVSGTFELVKQLDLYNDFAALLDETNFLVKQPQFPFDETQDVQFVTSDGFNFNVKT